MPFFYDDKGKPLFDEGKTIIEVVNQLLETAGPDGKMLLAMMGLSVLVIICIIIEVFSRALEED